MTSMTADPRNADTGDGRKLADGLPPAGSDYWERPERQPTLGTAAALALPIAAAAIAFAAALVNWRLSPAAPRVASV